VKSLSAKSATGFLFSTKPDKTKTNFSPKSNFKQFKVTFLPIGSKTA
jgi:hypothetical protein